MHPHGLWRRSSYSANGARVETLWHRPTVDGEPCSDGSCVEALASKGEVFVRDSKLDGDSPLLAFPQPAWREFIAAVKTGAFHG